MSQDVNDKRHFFRVSFFKEDNVDCKAKLYFQTNESKYLPIEIVDLSGGGLRFKSSINMPVNYDSNILLNFHISLNQDLFQLTGQVIWKKEYKFYYYYGAKFFKISATEQASLIRALNLFQMKKVKTKREAIPPKKQVMVNG